MAEPDLRSVDPLPRGEAVAELATLRILVAGVAVSVVVAAISAFAVVDTEGRVALPAWLVAMTASAFLVFVIVGAAAVCLGARALRVGAAAGVVLFLLALLLFAPASGILHGAASTGTLPWALTAIGGIAVAAVAAGGARAGWSVIIVWACVIAVYRIALGGYSLNGLANDAQALTAAATLCVISAHALRTSRSLDAAAARSEVAMAAEGAARGRLAARARVASFVHDEVLAALRGAADAVAGGAPDGDDSTTVAAKQQAQRAVAMIDAEREPDDWIERLQALAATADADFQVRFSSQPVAPSSLVVDAILVATRQALENSVVHAGPCTRSVRLEVGSADVTVWIVDDGVGFSQESVAPGRLGVRTSIVGSMRDVAGGTAEIDSQPGSGTSVRLSWRAPADLDEGPPATSAGELPAFPRVGALVAMTLFLGTQTLVAATAAASSAWGTESAASSLAPTTMSEAWWVPLAVLTGILIAALWVLPLPRRRPDRSMVAVVVLCGTVGGALLATPGLMTYGHAWFLPAAAFVLVAVALAARPGLALAGLAVILVMFIADAAVRGADPVELQSVVVRTATIVGLGTLLSTSIVRMRRTTRALARRTTLATRQREWDAAARRELEAHMGEVDALAGPLLARVAAGETLDPAARAQAGAIEGRLRDGYRAGRLQQPELIAAAMDARIRGVDVVLLDDAGEGDVDPGDAAAIAAWMTSLLAGAERRFVGRLLPQGRRSAAQVVVDSRVEEFAGPAQPLVSVAGPEDAAVRESLA